MLKFEKDITAHLAAELATYIVEKGKPPHVGKVSAKRHSAESIFVTKRSLGWETTHDWMDLTTDLGECMGGKTWQIRFWSLAQRAASVR